MQTTVRGREPAAWIRGRPRPGSSPPHRSPLPRGSSRWPVTSAWGPSGPETGGAERDSGGRAGELLAWGSGGSAAPAPRGFLAAIVAAGGRREAGNLGPPAWRSHTEPHADPGELAQPRARGAGWGHNRDSAPRTDAPLSTPSPDPQQQTPPSLCPAQTWACQPGGKPQRVPPAVATSPRGHPPPPAPHLRGSVILR